MSAIIQESRMALRNYCKKYLAKKKTLVGWCMGWQACRLELRSSWKSFSRLRAKGGRRCVSSARPFRHRFRVAVVSAVFATISLSGQFQAQAQGKERSMEHPISYRTIQIDGLSIFYRKAGPKDAPTLFLLHGLPSSSRMFEPLFPRLWDPVRLVAPG